MTLPAHRLADADLGVARRLPALNTHLTVVEVADAPHGLAWTYSDEVNAAILGFLESQLGVKQQ